jgi:aminoglycoside 6'-N-acetyltransferase
MSGAIVSESGLTIRRLRDDPVDFERMARWRAMPHVHEWWDPDEPAPSADEIAQAYRARTDPDHGTTACIIELDGAPIGYLQFYRWADYPEVPVAEDRNVWGIDVHIGEPDLIGRGLGTRTVELICRYLADERGAAAVALTTELTNARAQRAYEKAGFEKIRHVLDTDTRGGERVWSWLMRWESEGGRSG